MSFLFFFNDTATTEIYTLSLHDALPIFARRRRGPRICPGLHAEHPSRSRPVGRGRSEEHTSELQSHVNLVCRLLLEKKKKKVTNILHYSNNRILYSVAQPSLQGNFSLLL